jgi:hypothetical protein
MVWKKRELKKRYGAKRGSLRLLWKPAAGRALLLARAYQIQDLIPGTNGDGGGLTVNI